MKTLLIREMPDEVHDILIAEAERNRRSKEKQALFILERALNRQPAETGFELADRIWNDAPPLVSEKAIDSYLKKRGRRSKRA